MSAPLTECLYTNNRKVYKAHLITKGDTVCKINYEKSPGKWEFAYVLTHRVCAVRDGLALPLKKWEGKQ